MGQDDHSILLNFNKFGPIFTDSDKNWLLSRPRKNAIERQKKAWFIQPLENFLGKSFAQIKEEEIKRYCEITDQETHLSLTPSQDYEQFTNRIIQPIILGKKYFALGEYISCIAMSGLAAEMMALVVWNMCDFSIAGKNLDNESQRILFGRTDQERRIQILRLINAIQDNDQNMFEEIRKIRNKYTHSWDFKNNQDKGNAKKVIRYALILFKNISGIDLFIDDDGNQQLRVNPRFLKFLKSTDSSAEFI